MFCPRTQSCSDYILGDKWWGAGGGGGGGGGDGETVERMPSKKRGRKYQKTALGNEPCRAICKWLYQYGLLNGQKNHFILLCQSVGSRPTVHFVCSYTTQTQRPVRLSYLSCLFIINRRFLTSCNYGKFAIFFFWVFVLFYVFYKKYKQRLRITVM